MFYSILILYTLKEHIPNTRWQRRLRSVAYPKKNPIHSLTENTRQISSQSGKEVTHYSIGLSFQMSNLYFFAFRKKTWPKTVLFYLSTHTFIFYYFNCNQCDMLCCLTPLIHSHILPIIHCTTIFFHHHHHQSKCNKEP